MKFTAIVPIMKYETKTYDVDLSKDEEKIIKAYEKWYDDMSDKNQQALIDTINKSELYFDPETEDFEDFVNEIVYDIRSEIYSREMRENEAIYDMDDIHNLTDGDFNFLD